MPSFAIPLREDASHRKSACIDKDSKGFITFDDVDRFLHSIGYSNALW